MPNQNLTSHLPARPTERDFQKIADSADFRHPLIEATLYDDLGYRNVHLWQRRWEFAMACAALKHIGCLQPDKVGVSFGAGYERPLYVLSRSVKTLFVTDLYESSSIWPEAQAKDPREFVLKMATVPCNEESIVVLNMDMRHAVMEDASIDFAYSLSSIEHIGDDNDFIAHFAEVARILKDDGVYVLTTTCILREETIRQPGTFLFSIQHLMRLASKAGLAPAPTFDARIHLERSNTPIFFPRTFETPDVYEQTCPSIFYLYADVAMGACCLVLRKGQPGAAPPPEVIGFHESQETMGSLVRGYLDRVWNRPVQVNPAKHGHLFISNPDFFCCTELLAFGSDRIECVFQFCAGKTSLRSTIQLFVQSNPTTEPAQIAHSDHQSVVLDLRPGQMHRHRFEFETKEAFAYCVLARVASGDKPEGVQLWLGRTQPVAVIRDFAGE